MATPKEVVHLREVRAQRLLRELARYDHLFSPSVVGAVYQLLAEEIERQSAT